MLNFTIISLILLLTISCAKGKGQRRQDGTQEDITIEDDKAIENGDPSLEILETIDKAESTDGADDEFPETPPDGETIELTDPCQPNPCMETPEPECIDSTTLRQYTSPGNCTPSEDTYSCDYPFTDTDCSASGEMICISSVCTNTIEQARQAPEGSLNLLIKNVYVSYVKPASDSGNGFFIQREQSGPALFMYLGSLPPIDIQQGNLVTVRINSVSDFHGLTEADDFTIVSNDGVAHDISFLIQDFTTGGTIDENTESELILINAATIVSGWIYEKDIIFGGGSTTKIYYQDFESLFPEVCPGMRISILAPASQYEEKYRLTPFSPADFTSIDNSGCGTIDSSNWDFENWSYSDPPEDFEKMTSHFHATEEGTIYNSGSKSANITWDSTNNQDFMQKWFTPTTGGTTYTFHVWIFDNDPAGRARVVISTYDSSKNHLTNHYGTYSSDSTTWQEKTISFTPTVSGYIRAMVRFYDISAEWDGDATIYLDDWAITNHVSYNLFDGAIDSWSSLHPPSVPLIAGTEGISMVIYAGLNDEGRLYIATNEVTSSLSDHFLYIWVGGINPTATVPAPWAKSGTVAAATSGGRLIALIQEESNGYCELKQWNDSNWATISAPDGQCGYDGNPDGSGYLEGWVDLPSVLSLTGADHIPELIALSVAPYGSSDGAELYSPAQIPSCTALCDTNIDPNESVVIKRAKLLLGNVR